MSWVKRSCAETDNNWIRSNIPPMYGEGPTVDLSPYLPLPVTAYSPVKPFGIYVRKKSIEDCGDKWSTLENCVVMLALKLFLILILSAIITWDIAVDAAGKRALDGTTGTGFLCEPQGKRFYDISVLCLGVGALVAAFICMIFAYGRMSWWDCCRYDSPWAIVVGVVGACCVVGLALVPRVHELYCP